MPFKGFFCAERQGMVRRVASLGEGSQREVADEWRSYVIGSDTCPTLDRRGSAAQAATPKENATTRGSLIFYLKGHWGHPTNNMDSSHLERPLAPSHLRPLVPAEELARMRKIMEESEEE